MNRMRTWVFTGFVLTAAIVAFVARPVAGADDDTAKVKSQLAAFVDAWNRHDVKALGGFYAEDADVMDPWRGKISGRAAIEKNFADMHTGSGALKASTIEETVDSVRFPAADVALTDTTCALTGATNPDGSKAPASTLLVTEIWKRSGDKWLIYACRPHVKAPATPAH